MIVDLVNQSIGTIIAIFLVMAMFSLGLDLTVRQIMDSLRDRGLVTRSLLVNLMVIPLLAIAITSLIPMHEGLRIGIVLYAVAAGTEGGPKFVQLIGGNTAFAFGLLVLLLTFTVAVVPLILPLVIPGAQIDTGAILIKLLLVVALPLSLGLFLNARYRQLANRLNPIAHRLAMFLLYSIVALLVYVNFEQFVSMQTSALLAGVLFFLCAFAVGYLAGGPDFHNRRALGIMTFGRNGSISMMIASEVFADDPSVLVMVTIMTATAVVVAVLIVAGMRRAHRV